MKRSFIENRTVRNKKSREKILKESKSFLIAKRFTRFVFLGGMIVDVITYHVTHKYFTFCVIFHITGMYWWKLQEDTI